MKHEQKWNSWVSRVFCPHQCWQEHTHSTTRHGWVEILPASWGLWRCRGLARDPNHPMALALGSKRDTTCPYVESALESFFPQQTSRIRQALRETACGGASRREAWTTATREGVTKHSGISMSCVPAGSGAFGQETLAGVKGCKRLCTDVQGCCWKPFQTKGETELTQGGETTGPIWGLMDTQGVSKWCSERSWVNWRGDHKGPIISVISVISLVLGSLSFKRIQMNCKQFRECRRTEAKVKAFPVPAPSPLGAPRALCVVTDKTRGHTWLQTSREVHLRLLQPTGNLT